MCIRDRYLGDIWGTEAGVRYDNQLTRADGYDWTGHRYGGNRHFENVTFTLGGHQHLGNLLTLATNFGMAWRAPHVYELYSNGNELSSGTFVKGDSTLRSEQSYKWVTSLCYHCLLYTSSLISLELVVLDSRQIGICFLYLCA